MNANLIVIVAAAAVLMSFAWGMVWHFRRPGQLSPGARRTAALGSLSAAVHLYGVTTQGEGWPGLSVPLYCGSAVLFWWAVTVSRQRLQACFCGGGETELVLAGPYRWIRHPFYAAYGLAWLAGVLATLWWPTLLTAAAMCHIYWRAARAEEDALREGPVGKRYREYQRRAGQFWPASWRGYGLGEERIRPRDSMSS